MSRPTHYWYGIAKKMVYRYPKLTDSTEQEKTFKEAIEKTLETTGQETDGSAKIKAVNIVCFDKVYTIDGAARKLNYSAKTIQRWINKFVNDVGRRAGF